MYDKLFQRWEDDFLLPSLEQPLPNIHLSGGRFRHMVRAQQEPIDCHIDVRL